MPSISTSRDAATQVQSLIEPWTQACLDQDWDAVLDMCTDDVVFMPPGAPAVTGAALRAFMEGFPRATEMSWSVDEIEEEGDIAWLRGPLSQTLVIDGEPTGFDGKYADVMHRGSDGRWRFSLIIWNSNQP